MSNEAPQAIILLAEDDPGDQELTRKALELSRTANKLYIVEDGEEALDFLKHRGKYGREEPAPRPDLILLDLNMPKIDGRQVLGRLRSDPELSTIPIVVLTTSCLADDVLQTYRLGASTFIQKPLGFKDFLDVVRVICQYWFQTAMLPNGANRYEE